MFRRKHQKILSWTWEKDHRDSEPPGKEALENFWANVWEKEKRHNERAEWIKQIENENQQTPTYEVRQKKKEFLDDGTDTTQKLTLIGYISLAGGRGLVQLEITCKTTTIGLNTYLNNKDDYLLKIARENDRGKKTMSIHHQAAKYGGELSLPGDEDAENEPATTYAQRVKLKAKHQALEQLKSKWEEKPFAWSVPKKNKRERCRARKNPQLAKYTWPQIRNRRFHYCCPGTMH